MILAIHFPLGLEISLRLFATFRNWLTTTLGLAFAVFSNIFCISNLDALWTIFRIDQFRIRRLLLILN